MKKITCKPEELFIVTEFTDGIYGQLMWYKLSFEDPKDRKSLSDGDESFENMCEAGRWTGMADMFLVNSTKHPHDVEVNERCVEEIRVKKNVASFIDEDLDFDYHNTPHNFDE